MQNHRNAAVITVVLLLLILLAAGCQTPADSELKKQSDIISEPYQFDIVDWEINALQQELLEMLAPIEADVNDTGTVKNYFDSHGTNKQIENQVEKILTRQIMPILAEEGIINALNPESTCFFPPIRFEFEAPPNILVVSARDEIKRLESDITLNPNLAAEEMVKIETQIDALGVSSLIVSLGGLGSYPAIIDQSKIRPNNIQNTIEVIIHEWLHHYLTFKPLGFLYALESIGLIPEKDARGINETAVSIIDKELAQKVYQRYYENDNESTVTEDLLSEFNSEMRRIRLEADKLLAEGEITEAEEFMNRERDSLAQKGYYIRKLNQAYFAFHGAYAADPQTPNPIGQDLQKLRQQSASIKEFLDQVSMMTSYEDLKQTLQKN